MPPPPPPADPDGYRLPPAQWAPQLPPYAAPPGWRPPPPPPFSGGPAGYASPPPPPGTWQPSAGYGNPGGWPPALEQGVPAPYGWAPGYPGNPKTNGMCIASFVLAVPPVSLITFGLGSLLGVVFGIVGLRQTRRDGTRGRGLGITGIILGALGLILGAFIIIGLTVDHSSGSSDSGNGSSNTISTMSQPG
jgi:hypothetical protein